MLGIVLKVGISLLVSWMDDVLMIQLFPVWVQLKMVEVENG